MELDNIKRRLRSEFKRRKDEQYLTFQINIRDMCKDALDKLEEQESLIKEMKDAAADIGLWWHTGKWAKKSKKELARRKVALDSKFVVPQCWQVAWKRVTCFDCK